MDKKVETKKAAHGLSVRGERLAPYIIRVGIPPCFSAFGDMDVHLVGVGLCAECLNVPPHIAERGQKGGGSGGQELPPRFVGPSVRPPACE